MSDEEPIVPHCPFPPYKVDSWIKEIENKDKTAEEIAEEANEGSEISPYSADQIEKAIRILKSDRKAYVLCFLTDRDPHGRKLAEKLNKPVEAGKKKEKTKERIIEIYRFFDKHRRDRWQKKEPEIPTRHYRSFFDIESSEVSNKTFETALEELRDEGKLKYPEGVEQGPQKLDESQKEYKGLQAIHHYKKYPNQENKKQALKAIENRIKFFLNQNRKKLFMDDEELMKLSNIEDIVIQIFFALDRIDKLIKNGKYNVKNYLDENKCKMVDLLELWGYIEDKKGYRLKPEGKEFLEKFRKITDSEGLSLSKEMKEDKSRREKNTKKEDEKFSSQDTSDNAPESNFEPERGSYGNKDSKKARAGGIADPSKNNWGIGSHQDELYKEAKSKPVKEWEHGDERLKSKTSFIKDLTYELPDYHRKEMIRRFSSLCDGGFVKGRKGEVVLAALLYAILEEEDDKRGLDYLHKKTDIEKDKIKEMKKKVEYFNV